MRHSRILAVILLSLVSAAFLTSLPFAAAYTDQAWVDSVHWSKTLRVYTVLSDLRDEASRSHRLNITASAIQRFNEVVDRGVCLRLDMEDDPSKANVVVQYQDWTILNAVLRLVGRNVAGQTVHASPPRKIDDATITLPRGFKYDSDGDGNADKELDDSVKINVAFHELIHAAGLNEHARDSNDLFYAHLQLDIVNGTAHVLNVGLGEETVARLRLRWPCSEIHPVDAYNTETYVYSPASLIQMVGSGFQPDTTYSLYSHESTRLDESDNFTSRRLNVTADAEGNLHPTLLRRAPDQGAYVMVVDFNGDGSYQKGLDPVVPFYIKNPPSKILVDTSPTWKTVVPGGSQEFQITVSTAESMDSLQTEVVELYPAVSDFPLEISVNPDEITQVGELTSLSLKLNASTQATWGPHLVSLTLQNQESTDSTAIVIKVQQAGLPPRTNVQASTVLLAVATLLMVTRLFSRKRRWSS